jgi:hypothetical protein
MSEYWRGIKLTRIRKQEREETQSWSAEVMDPDDTINWGADDGTGWG